MRRAGVPRIVLLPGDGIGPEVMAAATEVLAAVGTFDLAEHPIGADAIRAYGVPLADRTLAACAEADAVLLGAVGAGAVGAGAVGAGAGAAGSAGAGAPHDAPRPEQGVLDLRSGLGVYANLRPVRTMPGITHLSALRTDRAADVDLVVVRELTGGIYYGPRGDVRDMPGEGVPRPAGDGPARRAVFDTCVYSADEIERVARTAFELARERARPGRPPRVTSVDKANVLTTSRLWREVVQEVADRDFGDVVLDHLLVDTAAMLLVTDPGRFDVILTENMFGDILSDETAAIIGSLGCLASASLTGLGAGGGLFEPVHGSAPDIAGKGVANPVGMILSVALMLRFGLRMAEVANAVEAAVQNALAAGTRTPDLGGDATTTQMTNAIVKSL
ncbi:3-isopropylmalate dehydrogenase [Streptosporangium oxazolinicum]|uniref:3-isopropylmalate dehydrogenase n=1 Tax=Streptosporangium oxazolinicum TaxID=909287 RepID=A0ABP8ALE8_9ACTN